MFSPIVFLVATIAMAPGFQAPILVAAQGNGKGFARSCVWQNVQIRNGDTIGTFCNNNNPNYYDYDYSQLPLRHCYGNQQGKLVAVQEGGFINSCHDCITKRDDTLKSALLTCTCSTSAGKLYRTTVDLNDLVYNDNGRLSCYNFRGSKERDMPRDE
ncbi:hypothetical protein BROUX41_000599 [Berkeleyomyces rouxiae]|uniref:uncharacterized protein n=1 Tax=Berkeleyomyces rouxiae TaxID=2035830 RepID=UPI003B7B646F